MHVIDYLLEKNCHNMNIKPVDMIRKRESERDTMHIHIDTNSIERTRERERKNVKCISSSSFFFCFH